MFLKGLFNDSTGNSTIAIAYPNLYIELKGKSVIVTHGTCSRQRGSYFPTCCMVLRVCRMS